MPRHIPLYRFPPAREGVLVTRAQLTQQRSAANVQHAAKARARALVREAQQQATGIQLQAYADGYQEGVMAASETIAGFLADSHELYQRLRAELDAHMRALMHGALDHADLLLALLDEWLIRLDKSAQEEELHLTLPRRAHPHHVQLLAALEASWHGRSTIAYHDAPAFIMRCGDQVAEFVPEQFIARAEQRLRTLVSDFSPHCQQLSHAALQRCVAAFTQHFVPSLEERETLA
ncbi:hypothetical protein ABH309_25130 [Chromobacterium piscinae]|uniref:Oxygen-regulated invasion protein OrgB n=1 Tax=Chromobacterium piscinae TaxID=686831 RepID=A0ABV0HDZ5_9NEIS